MRKILGKIKKGYDAVVEKIGLDKITHASVYGMVVAISGQFGWIPALVAFMIMWILSIIKEDLDSTVNWYDILAGVVGGSIAMITSLISFFV